MENPEPTENPEPAKNSEPAKPRRSHKGLFLGIGIIALLVAAMCFSSYAISRSTTLQFSHDGKEVKAEITKLSKNGQHSYFVNYRYKDALDKVKFGADEYPFPEGKDLNVGQQIEVVYLPNSRNLSRIARKQVLMVQRLEHVPWVMIGVLAAIGLGSIALGIRKSPPAESA